MARLRIVGCWCCLGAWGGGGQAQLSQFIVTGACLAPSHRATCGHRNPLLASGSRDTGDIMPSVPIASSAGTASCPFRSTRSFQLCPRSYCTGSAQVGSS